MHDYARFKLPAFNALDGGRMDLVIYNKQTDLSLWQSCVSIKFLLHTAGTDTTTTSLHWSVALMAKHPDIQAKVAEEIDNVVGRDRLPQLSDRGNLPYTEAAIGEMMRYGSVAPLGVTHTAIEDSTLGEMKKENAF